jgi:hypothetical protein
MAIAGAAVGGVTLYPPLDQVIAGHGRQRRRHHQQCHEEVGVGARWAEGGHGRPLSGPECTRLAPNPAGASPP